MGRVRLLSGIILRLTREGSFEFSRFRCTWYKHQFQRNMHWGIVLSVFCGAGNVIWNADQGMHSNDQETSFVLPGVWVGLYVSC